MPPGAAGILLDACLRYGGSAQGRRRAADGTAGVDRCWHVVDHGRRRPRRLPEPAPGPGSARPLDPRRRGRRRPGRRRVRAARGGGNLDGARRGGGLGRTLWTRSRSGSQHLAKWEINSDLLRSGQTRLVAHLHDPSLPAGEALAWLQVAELEAAALAPELILRAACESSTRSWPEQIWATPISA